MEPAIVDQIDTVNPIVGEIKISTIDERKSSTSQESSNHQESANIKLKRCRHGRIIIKDPSKKRQTSDIKETNQLDSTVNNNPYETRVTHQNELECADAGHPAQPDSSVIPATESVCEYDAALEIEADQSVSNDKGVSLIVDESPALESPKNDKLCEVGKDSPVIKISKKQDICTKVASKIRDSRSRSRSPLRKRSSSPSHRKSSPRRYQRGKSPRRHRSSRSPRRRDRSRSPRLDDRTSSYRTSSRRSRQLSPRRKRESPNDYRRNQQSARNRSPRRRRSRSRSRSRSPSYKCNARLDDRKHIIMAHPSKLDTFNPKLISRETLAFRATNPQDHSEKMTKPSITNHISDTKSIGLKNLQSGNDDSKTPQSARSTMSPFSENSATSDIYDPEGPIIPISPGDSPPLPSPTNNAASNNNNNNNITFRYDSDKNDDDVPSSAVQLNQQEKYLQKLNRQERVVEEVKLALKPHYGKRAINKEQYKDVLRRAVPKICHSKNGEINPIKIRALVDAYVKKIKRQK